MKPTARNADHLTGAQKSAVLCMALGAERAAQVFQQLTQAEVEEVSREIAAMTAVGPDVVQSVLQEYEVVSRETESVARGGVDVAQNILETALGAQRSRDILARVQEQVVDTGLKRLRKAPPEVLAGILRGEHPQTIALILAHLDQRRAARVLAAMNQELAADVLYRVARMDKISPDVLSLIETGLGSRTDLSLSDDMTLSGGPAAVAKMLNLAGGQIEKDLLAAIDQKNGEVAQAIRNLMFVFEDLLLVDGRGIQRLLREVESKELALALKAASDELKQHIRANMSERAGQALEEEIEMLGPVRVKDVEAAHVRIIGIVRGLEEAGEIMVKSRGGSDDIIG